MNRNSNEHGFAIVYALIILLIATISGIAILFITRKDREGVSDQAKIYSASQAALTALKACEGQFLNNSDTALAILKKYTTDTSYRWLLASSVDGANTETVIRLWNKSTAPRYSAKILSFDDDEALIIIEGIGYGNNGGKKRAVGSYHLGGIGKATATVATSSAGQYALYLPYDATNLNVDMTITGNVYLGGTFSAQNAHEMVIDGNLWTNGTSASTPYFQSKLRVTGNAYFQNDVIFQQDVVTIEGMAGFEKNPTFNSVDLVVGGNAFANAAAYGSGKLALQTGNTLLHSGSFPTARVSGGTCVSNGGTVTDIPGRLGMCAGDTGMIRIDISKIPKSYWKSYGTVMGTSWSEMTADKINDYYETHNNSTDLWNGFLVIKPGPSDKESPQWSATPGTLKYKVIWILDTIGVPCMFNVPDGRYWYNSTATSMTLIYVDKGSQIVPLQWNGSLRALIYLGSTSYSWYFTQVRFKCLGQKLIGSYVSKAHGDAFELNGTNTLDIEYDDGMVQTFVDLGLATRVGSECGSSQSSGGSGSASGELILTDIKIRPTQLNMQL